jgi:DNA polymerase III gamma/tau subunit
MVVKSAGAESELLVLTAEQRERTVELAEKFDTAGLVYNITALEKLRWTIKNSDTPRALLEATLLRFALSEHFLDVDALLSQLKGGADSTIKKKQPIRPKPQASNEPQSHRATEPQSSEQQTTKITQRESSNEHQASRIENRGRTRGQSRNEIISDPAVKTVLMGLDATITGIEENRPASD